MNCYFSYKKNLLIIGSSMHEKPFHLNKDKILAYDVKDENLFIKILSKEGVEKKITIKLPYCEEATRVITEVANCVNAKSSTFVESHKPTKVSGNINAHRDFYRQQEDILNRLRQGKKPLPSMLPAPTKKTHFGTAKRGTIAAASFNCSLYIPSAVTEHHNLIFNSTNMEGFLSHLKKNRYSSLELKFIMGKDYFVIFPPSIAHSQMLDYITDKHGNKPQPMWAGFVNVDEDSNIYTTGKSDSLGLSSSKESTELLKELLLKAEIDDIGYHAIGKSSLIKDMAKELGMEAVDLDAKHHIPSCPDVSCGSDATITAEDGYGYCRMCQTRFSLTEANNG